MIFQRPCSLHSLDDSGLHVFGLQVKEHALTCLHFSSVVGLVDDGQFGRPDLELGTEEEGTSCSAL